MARRLHLFLSVCLIGQAFCVPTDIRSRREFSDNEVDFRDTDLVAESSNVRLIREDDDAQSSTPSATESEKAETTTKLTFASPAPDSGSDEDDDFEHMQPASTGGGGGSNLFSILRLAGAFFPGSSSGGFIQNIIRNYITQFQGQYPPFPLRRQDTIESKIDIDLPPPLNSEEGNSLTDSSGSESQTNESADDDDDSSNEIEDDDEELEQASEESKSVENSNVDEKDKKSKQDSSEGDDDDDKDNDDNDSDYNDEPEGDGQGGGILGLLAGLSGGEDGQSDLGSLLAAVSGIVANLSGDGIDLNALIASGIGLFVGLLSEGEENPGSVIASYLLTSLDTISGGGSKNNGAFFGTFLSKLIRGTSAAEQEGSSEENGKEPMKDSAGFFASFLMSLLGDMSKGSSGGSSNPHPSETERIYRNTMSIDV